MNAKDLVKGKAYWYTANSERIKVEYLAEGLNGYIFTDGRVKNLLTWLSVEKCVEEIKTKDHEND